MKLLTTILLLILSMINSAQVKIVKKTGWVTDPEVFLAKDGREMIADTLVLEPLKKFYGFCCLHMCYDNGSTWLMDFGVYKSQLKESTTLRVGMGKYWANSDFITTLDVHYNPELKARAYSMQFLKQVGTVRFAQGVKRVKVIRTGITAGIHYEPNIQAMPFIEPSVGLLLPHGRSHLSLSNRMLSLKDELKLVNAGWNLGFTIFLTCNY